MTQKLVGKHYMYSSLLLLLDKGETIISKEKKKINVSPLPRNMNFSHFKTLALFCKA